MLNIILLYLNTMQLIVPTMSGISLHLQPSQVSSSD